MKSVLIKILLFLLCFSPIYSQNKYDRTEGFTYLAQGRYNSLLQLYEDALENHYKAFDYGKKNEDLILESEAISDIYLNLRLCGEDQAADSLRNLYEEFSSRVTESNTVEPNINYLIGLANIYYYDALESNSGYENAIRMFESVISYSEKYYSGGQLSYIYEELAELNFYNYDDAKASYYNNKAIELAQENKEFFVLGDAFFNKAYHLNHSESLELMIELLQKSIAAYESLGVDYFQLNSYSFLCEALIRTNQLKKALENIIAYNLLSRKYNHKTDILYSFDMIARIIAYDDKTHLLTNDILLTLNKIEDVDISLIRSEYLAAIAIFYWSTLNDLEKAEEYFEYARETYSSKDQYSFFGSYAFFLRSKKLIDSCLVALNIALEIYLDKNQPDMAMITYINIGDVYALDKFDYHTALRYYEQALEYLNRLWNDRDTSQNGVIYPEMEFTIYERFAMHSINMGLYQDAKLYCYKALKCNLIEKESIYAVLALIYKHENNVDSTIYYDKKVLESNLPPTDKLYSIQSLIDYYLISDNKTELRDLLKEIDNITVESDTLDKESLSSSYIAIAVKKFFVGETDYEQFFNKADSLAELSGNYYNLSNSLKFRAIMFMYASRFKDAFTYVDSSIRILNEHILLLPEKGYMQGFIANTSRILIPLELNAAIQCYNNTSDKYYLNRMIDLSEYVTARTLISSLRSPGKTGSEKLLLNQKILEFQNIISTLNKELISLKDEQQIENLLNERNKIYKEYKIFNDELLSNQYHFNLSEFTPINIKDIQNEFLGKNEMVIRYFVHNFNTSAVAFSRDDIYYYELPPIDQIEIKVKSFINYYKFYLKNTAAELHTLKKFGSELFNDLLGPIADKIKDKNLIIIPDQILYYLPFEMLVTDTTNFSETINFKDINFLIKDHIISYATSLSLLYYLEKKENVRTDKVLLIGESTFNKVQFKDNRSTSREMLTQIDELQDLPGVENELRCIAQNFKSNNYSVEMLLNENASEEEVKQKINSSEYEYLHIATHGFLDDSNPQFSALVFDEITSSSDSEDGLLQSYEIVSLVINTDLTVLSACNTGLGKIYSGEGMIGLNQSFFIAGSKSLCLTLWSISDASTSLFMNYFYSNLSAGMTKREALRQAKLSLMSNEKYSSPYYWAPYILSGAFD